MAPSLRDRRRGALLGLSVGDAMGAPVEFEDPGGFEPVRGFRAGGPHDLAAGEWTDDTSMALALEWRAELAGRDVLDPILDRLAGPAEPVQPGAPGRQA